MHDQVLMFLSYVCFLKNIDRPVIVRVAVPAPLHYKGFTTGLAVHKKVVAVYTRRVL